MITRLLLCCLATWFLQAFKHGLGDDSSTTTIAKPMAGDKPGAEFRFVGLRSTIFRWCPPGGFQMGSRASEDGRDEDEVVVEQKVDSGFWIADREVTQSLWSDVMGTQPWTGKKHAGENKLSPATFVSYEAAKQFCRTLTDRELKAGRLSGGWEFRLPTEVEWEYACRAGSDEAYCYGNSPALLSNYAWYNFLDSKEPPPSLCPQPVGTKLANNWGLFDVHGNVFEWCEDWYSDAPPGSSKTVKQKQRVFRVQRGGGWDTSAVNCRCAFRAWGYPDDKFDNTGFRLVASKKSKGNGGN